MLTYVQTERIVCRITSRTILLHFEKRLDYLCQYAKNGQTPECVNNTVTFFAVHFSSLVFECRCNLHIYYEKVVEHYCQQDVLENVREDI